MRSLLKLFQDIRDPGPAPPAGGEARLVPSPVEGCGARPAPAASGRKEVVPSPAGGRR